MPHGLHAAWMHSAHRALPAEMRAHATPSALADCWVTVERLPTDLIACLRVFERGGGVVDWAKVEQHVKPEPINPSEHAHCKAMFIDPALAAAVERAQRGLFDTFGYGSCCSQSNDPRIAGQLAART